MGDAQRGDDALAFYAANLGRTRAIACSTVAAQLLDDDGALLPVRHILHLGYLSPRTSTIWIATGKFERGKALSVSAAPPYFPMTPGRIVALELNVRKGDNDQIAAIMASGSGILYITEISRRV